jgi:hypothetical protein
MPKIGGRFVVLGGPLTRRIALDGTLHIHQHSQDETGSSVWELRKPTSHCKQPAPTAVDCVVFS